MFSLEIKSLYTYLNIFLISLGQYSSENAAKCIAIDIYDMILMLLFEIKSLGSPHIVKFAQERLFWNKICRMTIYSL